MSETRASFGKVARLCQMYLDQYRMYEAAQASPDMQRATAIAEESLTELLLSLEKMVSPITFMSTLEAGRVKEDKNA